jgi:hypothetical protein
MNTRIGTTFLTLAGGRLAPALCIDEKEDGSIFALVHTENADVRLWLSPAPVSEIAQLRDGQYLHPVAAIP